jgi:translation initiation factor IF-1
MQLKESEQLIHGMVIEALPATTFRVQVNEEVILCHLSGKMRMHHIKVYPGDKVLIRLSPDKKRGIVMRRL